MKTLVAHIAHSVVLSLSVFSGCLESRRMPADKDQVPPPRVDKRVPDPMPDVPQLEPAPLPEEEGPSLFPFAPDEKEAPPPPSASRERLPSLHPRHLQFPAKPTWPKFMLDKT